MHDVHGAKSRSAPSRRLSLAGVILVGITIIAAGLTIWDRHEEAIASYRTGLTLGGETPKIDGSKVASFGLPGSMGERYDRVMAPYGYIVLLLLVMSGVVGRVLAPIQYWILGALFGLMR